MKRRFPLITAHTGSMNTRANSLTSIEACLRSGADIFEEDIVVTKDGVPVLSHDDHWRYADDRQLRISQMSYEDLKREADEVVPLEQLLTLVKPTGTRLNLDLKTDDGIEAVAFLLRKYDMIGQAFATGCEAGRAMKAQREHPELVKLLNVTEAVFEKRPYDEAMAKACEDAAAAACIGININYKWVRPELIDYAAARGLPVYVWTVNDKSAMRQMAELGVHSITTRRPDLLLQLRQELEEKP